MCKVGYLIFVSDPRVMFVFKMEPGLICEVEPLPEIN